MELSAYLEKLGTEKIVWLSEDATAITSKVNYDVVTDTLVGLVSPINSVIGCPTPFHYKASSAKDITENMKKDKATSVYLIMAQPLDEISAVRFAIIRLGSLHDGLPCTKSLGIHQKRTLQI